MIKKIIPYLFWTYFLTLLIVTCLPEWSTDEHYGVGGFNLRLDYWLHFFTYLGLEFLFIIYKFKQQPIEKLIRVYTKSLWILGFAILSEILQIYIPGRNFSIKDFVANTSGITIGLLIFMLFQNRILKLLFNDYEALNDTL